MLVLGIETSCDETSVALVEGAGERVRVIKQLTASQINIHKKYGGVVPEVAARKHAEVITLLLDRVLKKTPATSPVSKGETKNGDLRSTSYLLRPQIIAVTSGPGLITSLMVGVETARALAYAWKVPLIAVNHIEGHIYSNWLQERNREQGTGNNRIDLRPTPVPEQSSVRGAASYVLRPIKFPALALIVSGGHTELILMKKHLHYKKLGATRDDAAGEAFDKVAKMLGLGYPGGPEIARLAKKGDPDAIKFPRPMISSEDYDFSFAGLKTAVLYWLMQRNNEQGTKNNLRTTRPQRLSVAMAGAASYALPSPVLSNLCASFEQAAVDVLVAKTVRAAKEYKVKTVLLGGGVAANTRLRQELGNAIQRELRTTRPQRLSVAMAGAAHYALPSLQFTGDNAAMIAAAGYFKAQAKKFTPWQKIKADPEWEL